MRSRIFSLLLIISIWLTACSRIDTFEKTVPIPQQKWFYNYTPSFSFDITDTASSYNIYLVIRHTNNYKYNNIWLKVDTQFPGDTTRSARIDMILGSDATGWNGKGMDDIYEYRKVITPGPWAFKRRGKYTFTLSQIMRENPIEHVMNIGVRVEKVRM